MRYDQHERPVGRPNRRSLRLKGYDYSQAGAYFITIVSQDRACLFGEVVNGEMRLNEFGEFVRDEWFQSAQIRQEIQLNPDEFVVMPNHIHGVVWIVGDGASVGAHGRAPLPMQRMPRSLASFIAGFKSAVTKRINERRGTPGLPVWQRNYYEHIVRDDDELRRIREYITNNPLQWALDRENPHVVGAHGHAPLLSKSGLQIRVRLPRNGLGDTA